jgi:AcrR family transcriptional regulator
LILAVCQLTTHKAETMTQEAENQEAGPPLRKGERTRRQLVQVAAALFAQRGYAATTYNDLVAASGLSRGGFYFHFRTKEDLALAVIDTKQREWEQRLRSRLAEIDSATRRLVAFGQTLLQIQLEDPSGLALNTVASELVRVPSLADQAQAVSRRWIERLSQIVTDAQAEGGIRDDLDAASLASVLMGSMAGVRQMATRFPTEDPQSVLDAHTRIWMAVVRRGLRPTDDPGATDQPAD